MWINKCKKTTEVYVFWHFNGNFILLFLLIFIVNNIIIKYWNVCLKEVNGIALGDFTRNKHVRWYEKKMFGITIYIL